MMKTKAIKFPALVVQEAKNLRKFATSTEKLALDINYLNPQSKYSCVYGLMTGNCHSERAIELIEQCAPRVYHSGQGTPGDSKKVNGSPKKTKRFFQGDEHGGTVQYWSPIEVFIDRNDSETNGKLLAFIKGERKKL